MTDQENKTENSASADLPPLKRYYRVDEVAHHFSVSASTIYRLIEMGELKAIRLRGCLRVPGEELRNIAVRSMIDF